MDAQLVGVAGALEGQAFTLAERTTIGRDRTSQLVIPDADASRHHCVIRKHKIGRLILKDQSANGTRVNGELVREQALSNDDLIAIGRSLFRVVLPRMATSAGVVADDAAVPETAVTLNLSESPYLDPERLQARLGPDDRVARDLNTLLRVSTIIGSADSVDGLQRQLSDLILEVVPAARCTILATGDEGSDPSVVAWSVHHAAETEPPRVSRTLVRKALDEGAAVLCTDVAKGLDADAKTLMCVPLTNLDRGVGVIFLESFEASVPFEEGHLQLVTAIARIAALALANTRRLDRLRDETETLRRDLGLEHGLIGDSPALRRVYDLIERVAPVESTVLIAGESGTGKELVARAIHRLSPRVDKALVTVNCVVLTDTLIASDLFGHERGAFPGAVAQKKGKIELADGGTLFLDEVGELSLDLQTKLLRVLEEHEFERVGGTRPLRVDIRVIAATNRNLEQASRAGDFRSDLYYRLNVVRLTMPPLRDRGDDVLLLAEHFLDKYTTACNRRVTGIAPEARAYLRGYGWPGNVRELQNAIERAVVIGMSDELRLEDLLEAIADAAVPETAAVVRFQDGVREAKRRLVINAVRETGGVYTKGAKLLGLHPNYLHGLIRNLNLKDELTQLKAELG